MFEIKVTSEFNGAHNLRGYEGKCENLHGHNWKVEAVVGKKDLDKLGMVTDFKIVKNELERILDGLDHKYLNDLKIFRKYNPTSERIAEYIYNELSKKIKRISRVTVWETDSSCATYFR